jgi:predicted nucleic acid-binding protein
MDSEIGDMVAPTIENPDKLIVPTIIIYEVYKKLAAEKDAEYALSVVLYMQSGTVVYLDNILSVFAAQTSRNYRLPMADSIIYATALRYKASLWTADQHFEHIPDVRYLPKKRQQ